MRNRYKKSRFYPEIAESIGRLYYKLRALCFRLPGRCFESRSYDDIFQDTVLFVIQDFEALKCIDDEALIEHFIRRYRMIEFQTIRDCQQQKQIPYADYLQTKEDTTQE